MIEQEKALISEIATILHSRTLSLEASEAIIEEVNQHSPPPIKKTLNNASLQADWLASYGFKAYARGLRLSISRCEECQSLEGCLKKERECMCYCAIEAEKVEIYG